MAPDRLPRLRRRERDRPGPRRRGGHDRQCVHRRLHRVEPGAELPGRRRTSRHVQRWRRRLHRKGEDRMDRDSSTQATSAVRSRTSLATWPSMPMDRRTSWASRRRAQAPGSPPRPGRRAHSLARPTRSSPRFPQTAPALTSLATSAAVRPIRRSASRWMRAILPTSWATRHPQARGLPNPHRSKQHLQRRSHRCVYREGEGRWVWTDLLRLHRRHAGGYRVQRRRRYIRECVRHRATRRPRRSTASRISMARAAATTALAMRSWPSCGRWQWLHLLWVHRRHPDRSGPWCCRRCQRGRLCRWRHGLSAWPGLPRRRGAEPHLRRQDRWLRRQGRCNGWRYGDANRYRDSHAHDHADANSHAPTCRCVRLAHRW